MLEVMYCPSCSMELPGCEAAQCPSCRALLVAPSLPRPAAEQPGTSAPATASDQAVLPPVVAAIVVCFMGFSQGFLFLLRIGSCRGGCSASEGYWMLVSGLLTVGALLGLRDAVRGLKSAGLANGLIACLFLVPGTMASFMGALFFASDVFDILWAVARHLLP